MGMSHRETRKYWQELIDEWELSGEGIRPFCRKKCIAKSAFYRWKRKLDPVSEPKSSRSASSRSTNQSRKIVENGFVELAVQNKESSDCGLWFELENGIKLVVGSSFDDQMLKRVLGVLTQC